MKMLRNNLLFSFTCSLSNNIPIFSTVEQVATGTIILRNNPGTQCQDDPRNNFNTPYIHLTHPSNDVLFLPIDLDIFFFFFQKKKQKL
jgi:hypothetical protein